MRFPILGCEHNKGVGFSQLRFSFSVDHLTPLALALEHPADAWCLNFSGYPSHECVYGYRFFFVLIVERLLFSSLAYPHI
jgi:hypothetical protein